MMLMQGTHKRAAASTRYFNDLPHEGQVLFENEFVILNDSAKHLPVRCKNNPGQSLRANVIRHCFVTSFLPSMILSSLNIQKGDHYEK
jgi:hypothetical protein